MPDYLNDPNAVATLPAGITNVMLASDRIFVSEVAHHPRQILFPGIVAHGEHNDDLTLVGLATAEHGEPLCESLWHGTLEEGDRRHGLGSDDARE